MRRLLIIFLTLISARALYAQQPDYNASLVGQLTYDSIRTNDVWGYTDATGVEYALVGIRNATSIVSLIDPAAPEEVLRIPGQATGWRDLKTWGDRAYVTCDRCTDGLLIIDLSPLPDGVPTYEFWTPILTINGVADTLYDAHNVYIDSDGYAYLSGGNLNQGGIVILDVDTPDGSPEYVGHGPAVYAHDCYVRGDTLYSAEIYEGEFAIYDITDRMSPELLAAHPTGFAFAHNVWLSDDSRTLFTTDEKPHARTEAYDITDLTDIRLLDRYRPVATEGEGVIPHNVHVLDDYLVISHYTDGLKVVDAHRPTNLVEVASYDTYPEAMTDPFDGAWGAYPYLPSGQVLVSDINTGLYVIEVEYRRAAYLEGTVTDAATSLPVPGADARILHDDQTYYDLTDDLGYYATGLATDADSITLTVRKLGYYPREVRLPVASGIVTLHNVVLQPQPRYTLSAQVLSAADGVPIAGAGLRWYNDDFEYEVYTDSAGYYELLEVVEGEYRLDVGAWGYLTAGNALQVVGEGYVAPTFYLPPHRYADPFAVDLGWQVSGTATDGHWELARPRGTSYAQDTPNPPFDIGSDVGDRAYVTGNGTPQAGGSFTWEEVDDGSTVLTSPPFRTRGMLQPALRFSVWYYNRNYNDSLPPDDDLRVYLTDGADTATLLTLTASTEGWVSSDTFLLADHLPMGGALRVAFEVRDTGVSSIVEAGIDAVDIFDMTDAIGIALPEVNQTMGLLVTPNPVRQGTVTVRYHRTTRLASPAQLGIYDMRGREVYRATLTDAIGRLPLEPDWPSGIYIVRVTDGQAQAQQKLVMVR